MKKKEADETKLLSIREVAQRFGLNESTLRFWEGAFGRLKPRKKNGRRQYSKEDVQLVQWIYQLVKVEKMTLDGARKVIASKKTVNSQVDMLDRLRHIRAGLVSLLEATERKKEDDNKTQTGLF
ncbi:MAG: MerR family transcriptional regulator [Tannerella sp.]|jgi:DNA-binding transcriptional MerR regulator|nr:MerR family transcriptional regulator [Tannerella sp.]